MILILCENASGSQTAGQQIAQRLQAAYQLPAPPEQVAADAVWRRNPEWDDLLIVVYGSAQLPRAAQDYIVAFRNAHQEGAFVIPVAVDAAHLQPPPPISLIKAAPWGADAQSLERIVTEVGVRLGLALRSGNRRIFISYRTTDGKAIAHDLHERLQRDGFAPWLDEAKENLHPGDDVQQTVYDHVKDAAMVLVVDTSDAPDSRWLFAEIDMAIAQLILIMPVVIGDRTSRFYSLASLRRQVTAKPGGVDGTPLSDGEWSNVRAEMDQLLMSAYRRRLALLSRARAEFERRHYDWTVLDPGRRMYQAQRSQDADPELPLPLAVLSHCLIHEITWLPALKAFRAYIAGLGGSPAFNYKLCLYDRERKLSAAERDFIPNELGGAAFYPIHCDQLRISLDTNFARI